MKVFIVYCSINLERTRDEPIEPISRSRNSMLGLLHQLSSRSPIMPIGNESDVVWLGSCDE